MKKQYISPIMVAIDIVIPICLSASQIINGEGGSDGGTAVDFTEPDPDIEFPFG